VWSGFWRLSATRPVGMNGPSRIPLSEVSAYCDLQRFSPIKREDFLFYTEHLDVAFMKHVADQQAEQERTRELKTNQPAKRGRR